MHKKALTLFGRICWLEEASIEKHLARRQLAIKADKSSGWFICIKSLFLKYRLPAPWELLDMSPTPHLSLMKKKQVKEQVDNYLSDIRKSKAALYPSLRYLHSAGFVPGSKHQSIQDANGAKDVSRIHTRIKIVTGTYVLQTYRASFNQNQVSPTCLLCQRDDETMEHFILHRCILDAIRQSILADIIQLYIYREDPAYTRQLSYSTAVKPKSNTLTVKLFEKHVSFTC